MATCTNTGCTNQIPPRNRLYCAVCSRKASAIWKRRNRPILLEDWRAGRTTADPRLDGWPDVEARRRYYREYMRAWRLKVKGPGVDATRFSGLVPPEESPVVEFGRGVSEEESHAY